MCAYPIIKFCLYVIIRIKKQQLHESFFPWFYITMILDVREKSE